MHVKYALIISLVVGLTSFLVTSHAEAQYSLILSCDGASPSLPYSAEADHYNAPACIQMILNCCPDITERQYHSQTDIYNSILLHNSEPTTWFSDPSGVEGALEDPVFSPCGHWVDFSNSDKSYVLGKLLYYMNTQQYLTPVSIGDSENWVTVIGYQTDVEPPYSGSVTLQNIFFYDPTPGNPSNCWVSGTTWLNDSEYWGVPLDKPGSTWDNKYIAIIEPPSVSIFVKWRKWVLTGPILLPEEVERYIYRWFNEIQEAERIVEPFEILFEEPRIRAPILVNAGDYSYYLVPFEDAHMAAIFNAYDGSFEEIRYFQRPQKFTVDPMSIQDRIRKTLREYGAEVSELPTPVLRYDPVVSPMGRISPTWTVQAVVVDVQGKQQRLPMSLDFEGKMLRGLEKLEGKPRIKERKEIEDMKQQMR